jgi:hypothetical protein
VFGRKFSIPLFISSMTGGSTEMGQVNRIIAEVCEEEQIEPEEIGAWIHDFKGLLQTIELNAKKHRLLNDTNEPLTTSLSDLFE